MSFHTVRMEYFKLKKSRINPTSKTSHGTSEDMPRHAFEPLCANENAIQLNCNMVEQRDRVFCSIYIVQPNGSIFYLSFTMLPSVFGPALNTTTNVLIYLHALKRITIIRCIQFGFVSSKETFHCRCRRYRPIDFYGINNSKNSMKVLPI